MRICFVAGEYPPDKGGVADYTALLAGSLESLGADVSVLTRRRHRWSAPPMDDRVQVYRAVPRWDMWSPQRVRKATSMTRPDVVHFQLQEAAFDMSFWVHLAPAWVRRRTAARVAVTYHDLRVPYLFPKAGRIREWTALQPARSADLVIATTAADMMQLGAAGVAATVVPIGSNIAAPSPDFDAAEWRATNDMSVGLLLVYFGLLNASKGLGVLGDVLGQLAAAGRNPRLAIVGSGTGTSDPTNRGSADHFDGQLRAAGVEDRVTHTGHLPPGDVAAWLVAADAVVLPFEDGASFRRGSLLAALACGSAIVTTTPAAGAVGTGLPELTDEHPALLVSPGDSVAIAKAVMRIADDPALAARLRRDALELAAAFTWPAIARRHLALYEDLGSSAPTS